jgi:diphthine-ammonia ligase
MRLGVLFSGGKDSNYAMYKASKKNEIKVLISIFSENEDSYMFHTPEIENVKVQSKKLGIPLIIKKTKGVKEEELKDLDKAIMQAIKEYKIEGIVTGAIASN